MRRLVWRGPPVDVQAVLDGEVFQIAEPRIDAAKHLVRRGRGIDAGFARKGIALRGLDDEGGKALAAPGIEAVGLGIFVDQALEIARGSRQLAVDKRRRQMADGDRRESALGLRGLARIADDEWIEDGQRIDHGFRKAAPGERHRLAGQPLYGAVRPHVHDRVAARDMAQPEPEGEERMTRRQCGVVILRPPRGDAAALGRQRDRDVAEALRAEAERPVLEIGIGLRLAPGCPDEFGDLGRQLAEQSHVVGERQGGIGIGALEPIEQRARGRRWFADLIAGCREISHERQHACRHVEADRIAGAPGSARIVRHQEREAPRATRRPLQSDQRGGALRHHLDTVRFGLVDHGGEGERGVGWQRMLVRDGAGEDAAVELRQHDVHGEICGAETARACLPGGAPGGGDDGLQHRHTGTVERRRLAWLSAGRKCGRADNDGRIEPRQRVGDERGGVRILEAGHEQRRRGKTARRERRA